MKLAVTPKGTLNVAVPYVGGALEAQIVDIIRTGTCTQLEQFRCKRNILLPPRCCRPVLSNRLPGELSIDSPLLASQ